MVVTIPAGASQGAKYPIKLSDAGGNYIVLLNGTKSTEKWSFPPLPGTEIHLDTDQNIASQMGAVQGDFQVGGNKYLDDQTTIDNLKKALVFWVSYGAPITFSQLNAAGAEQMRWPAYSTLAMTAIKVRVMGLQINEKDGTNMHFDLALRRFNTS